MSYLVQEFLGLKLPCIDSAAFGIMNASVTFKRFIINILMPLVQIAGTFYFSKGGCQYLHIEYYNNFMTTTPNFLSNKMN